MLRAPGPVRRLDNLRNSAPVDARGPLLHREAGLWVNVRVGSGAAVIAS
jgi:hypothetical protein